MTSVPGRLARARASFWLEWGKEMRRHAGDGRLPWALRSRLREHAHRALGRSGARAPVVTAPANQSTEPRRPQPLQQAAAPAAIEGAAGRGPVPPATGRVLFVMLHPGFVRYFEPGILALAAAGFDVDVAFEINRTKLGEDVTAQRLAAASPRIACLAAPERVESVRDFLARSDRAAVRAGDAARRPGREESWESLATTVRLLQDYLRFFDPAFAAATALRARAAKRLPRIYVTLIDRAARFGTPARAALAGALRVTERLIPVPPAIEAFVRARRPDLLVVTPLIELGSQQVDYVKCAARLGIPSALAVASWDNLTSKGLIRVVPDHVIVWNEGQREEAVTMHGVPSSRVAVTGAVPFDRWFEARPTRSREEFCRHVGLDPARPFVLYVGSSQFIAPDEVPFAERWAAAVRTSSDPAVASAGILIRPHPANARQWTGFNPSMTNVALWPPIDTDPTASDFWRDYHESLHYSAAVVGINTSAQIEAAIVGRPVLTVQSPEFAHGQSGTLHFRRLVGGSDGPGAVRSATSLGEHVDQLSAVLAGDDDAAGRRAFVASFVRPRGVEQPAASVFARTVAEIATATSTAPRSDPAWVRALRAPAFAGAVIARRLAEDRPLWVYAARPVIALSIWTMAAGYRVADRADATRVIGKRLRRGAWRAWYEGSRHVQHRARRALKPARRLANRAGAGARRLTRWKL